MKKPALLMLCSAIATAAFLAGRWSAEATGSGIVNPRTATLPSLHEGLAPLQAKRPKTAAAVSAEFPLSLDQIQSLTTPERMALMKKGALIFDSAKQAEYLCTLISQLTKDELSGATKILGSAQDRGNFCAQSVWDSVWKQWGKVDAKNCLAGLGTNPQGKPLSDAKNVMKGWLETDPQAALAWAKEPKGNSQEAAAAAHALILDAGGDLKKMEAIIQAAAPGSMT